MEVGGGEGEGEGRGKGEGKEGGGERERDGEEGGENMHMGRKFPSWCGGCRAPGNSSTHW